MTDEEDIKKQREQKQDITKNLPKDWEKQLRDDEIKDDLERKRKEQQEEAERQAKIQQKLDAAKKANFDAMKAQKEAAAKKQKDLEDRAAKQKAIAEKAERIKQNQYDKEKAQEFREMKASNEAKLKATADEQSALLRAKTNSERIKIRQRIESRQRAENARVEMVNAGKQQPVGHRLITPGTIKESIQASVKKTPVAADRAITSMFGNFTDRIIAPTTDKRQNATYRQEMKLMSKVVNRRKISTTPTKQILVLKKTDLMANPDFTSALLGDMPLQTQTGKSKKAGRKGLMSGLDGFAKRLF